MDHQKELQELRADLMEEMKIWTDKFERQLEKQIWKTMRVPCNLYEALITLTMGDLNEIRQHLNIKGISGLKKADMVIALNELIPAKFDTVLYALDQGRYNLLKEVAKNGGIFSLGKMSPDQALSLRRYSLLYPTEMNGQHMLVMPNELRDRFLNRDNSRLQEAVKRNTEWIWLTHSMVFYYGVVDTGYIMNRIQQLSSYEVDLKRFIYVMSVALDTYKLIGYSEYGYYYHTVNNQDDIITERNKRSDLKYYPFTKEQLYKIEFLKPFDRTPEVEKFISFISDYYNIKNDQTDEFVYNMVDIINNTNDKKDMFTFIQKNFILTNSDITQHLHALAMDLYNHTRMWRLKGYTPKELSCDEQPQKLPVSDERLESTKNQEKRTYAKVGRNDLCPCGSGKKYKKCCGK